MLELAMEAQQIITIDNIIPSKSIAIDSLKQVPEVCKQMATAGNSEGAALVQCRQLLPTDACFPEQMTNFYRP